MLHRLLQFLQVDIKRFIFLFRLTIKFIELCLQESHNFLTLKHSLAFILFTLQRFLPHCEEDIVFLVPVISEFLGGLDDHPSDEQPLHVWPPFVARGGGVDHWHPIDEDILGKLWLRVDRIRYQIHQKLFYLLLLELGHILPASQHCIIDLACIEQHNPTSSIQQPANLLDYRSLIDLQLHAASPQHQETLQPLRIVNILIHVEVLRAAQAIIGRRLYVGAIQKRRPGYFIIAFVDVICGDGEYLSPFLFHKLGIVCDVITQQYLYLAFVILFDYVNPVLSQPLLQLLDAVLVQRVGDLVSADCLSPVALIVQQLLEILHQIENPLIDQSGLRHVFQLSFNQIHQFLHVWLVYQSVELPIRPNYSQEFVQLFLSLEQISIIALTDASIDLLQDLQILFL